MTRKFVILFVLGIVAGLIGLILLPHNRYFRYQAHQLQNVRKADWIYERLHFDPTPIDVALIGTSRMNGGISSPQLARDYCRLTGRRIHVANLALPQFGRNMDYVFAKELFATKSPALVVLQAAEVEGRRPHPAFLTLADASDILTAPLLLNLDWVSNIADLPGRQMTMALDTLLDRPAVRSEFDPKAYGGPELDDTDGFYRIDGTFQSQEGTPDPEALRAEAERRRRGFSKTYLLPKPLQFLEYRVSRIYLDKIYAMAEKAGAEVAFVYMPAFTFKDPVPPNIAGLIQTHPLFNVNEGLTESPEMWLNFNHVNMTGARISTRNLAENMARTYPDLGSPDTGCAETGKDAASTQ